MKANLRYYAYYLPAKLLSLLPLAVLYAISDGLYFLVAKVLKYRRRIIRENLASCFPEKSADELLGIERKFYHQLCDDVVETIKLLTISDRTIDRRIIVEGVELVNRAAEANRSVVIFLGHYCNWEWVPAITRHIDPRMYMGFIYKPQRDAAGDRLMLKARSRFCGKPIPQHYAVRTLLGVHKEGKPYTVGFIADHRSNSSVVNQRVMFLNHSTPFNVGGETIGDRTDAVYVYLDVEKKGRGRYTLTFKPIVPDPGDTEPYPYTRRYFAMLEQTIRRQPAYWLWSHRRWLFH